MVVGTQPSLRQILTTLDTVACSEASVLLTGESGTGKEVIAQYIHKKSDRKNGPWVAVNCAALPRDVIENELFGHEKDAYTGASSRRAGCFELAHGGTLFLDEIAEVHPQLQAKLLRAIELKTFRRIGGSEEITVDARVVAATNRNIQEALSSGTFRHDLYYRLSVVEIALPPLRERTSDVSLLASYFACQLCGKYGKSCKTFSPEVLPLLAAYPWPGNVRELRNLMEALVLTCPDAQIRPHHLPDRFKTKSAGHRAGDASRTETASKPGNTPQPGDASLQGDVRQPGQTIPVPVGTPLEDAERLIIERTLEELKDNKSEAARVLGVSRKYLYAKLREYRR